MKTGVMKKRATKHCTWSLCKSDSCYPESIPEETHFIRFANVGKVKHGMTECEKISKISSQRKGKRALLHFRTPLLLLMTHHEKTQLKALP